MVVISRLLHTKLLTVAFTKTKAETVDGNKSWMIIGVSTGVLRNFIQGALSVYMCFNNNLFPGYNQNQNEDMYPDGFATFTGWVL
ncbi:MAG: hypothetical protein CM15mV90_260 [uncultured marine virus]|nr:MAG: hypothetical protein CM15mV90_260 [uncultured marine virus]